jgi:CheY-like chemotaxis protein
VLVVEDEAPVRDGMERLLRTWKCDAVVVGDTASALQALADGMRPDMLIVDYRLADGGNGLQAIARIRADAGRAIPALIVSGESHPEELARIKASGFHIVHKPVPPARLRSVVAWLLTRDREAA